jgi:trehalose 6-phosphate phosphatase
MPVQPCPPDQAALFLDFDGTLAEIAPRPQDVRVPAALPGLLARLRDRLGGALAIITGRPVAEIDHFLAPLRLAVAGVHGAEGRQADGRHWQLMPAGLGPALARAEALAAAHPALLLERKGMALALHYRAAPHLEALCLETLAQAARETPDVELMRGKCVVELKPSGASKGRAIEAFMREPPFARRRPVFIGDDVTDEAGFETVLRLGGEGIKVGAGASLAPHRLADPQAVFEWLAAWVEAPA